MGRWQSDNKHEVAADIEEGKEKGRYKDCSHLKLGENNFPYSTDPRFFVYCEESSLQKPESPDLSGAVGMRLISEPQCPKDCRFHRPILSSPDLPTNLTQPASALPKIEEYELALSFAGEDRQYVEQVAEILRAAGVRVFYDLYEKVDLWGENLVDRLGDVYGKHARYVVLFISKHYAAKAWPNHERQSAQARAIEEGRSIVLPARFDDTEIRGLPSTVGHIDLRTVALEDFAKLILEKLGRRGDTEVVPSGLSAAAARIRQAKEADADRVRFLAAEGTQAAKAEAARLFDEMSVQSKALGILVERDDHYLQACFHFEGFTLGVGWQPSEYINTVEDGKLTVTLWDGRWALRPSVLYSRAMPRVARTTTYRFDVTPFEHEVRWCPDNSDDQPLSTAGLANAALGRLLGHVEGLHRNR